MLDVAEEVISNRRGAGINLHQWPQCCSEMWMGIRNRRLRKGSAALETYSLQLSDLKLAVLALWIAHHRSHE
jgi:hypothetical protein